MRIALIDTAIPINTRNQKILNSLRRAIADVEIYVISWVRDGSCFSEQENYLVYNKESKYGSKWKKLHNLQGYSCFVKKTLVNLEPDVVIASHWDTLVLVPKKIAKNSILIYENLDVPTGPWPVRVIEKTLERNRLQDVDLIVHASRFFKELYSSKFKQIVIENKTQFEFTPKNVYIHNPLNISYIGLVRYRDILYNLIEAAKQLQDKIVVRICGGGQDLEEVKDYAKSVNNVFFTGRYSFEEIPLLYTECDVVWAAYPNKDYNVKYAISNKFHESIMNRVPGIYSRNTKLGDYVEKEKIGYTVNPYSVNEIIDLIESIISDPDGIVRRSKKLSLFSENETTWDEDIKVLARFISEKHSKC